MQSSTESKTSAFPPGLLSTAFNPNKLFLFIAIALFPHPDSCTAKLAANKALTPN